MTVLSTRPKVLDLELYAGDSFAIQFEFVDEITESPYPLEGTWQAQIRNRTEVLDEFTVDTSDQGTGIIRLSLTGGQTTELGSQAGCYRGMNGSSCGSNCPTWDLEQTYPAGPRTWYRGTVHTAVDVTRLP